MLKYNNQHVNFPALKMAGTFCIFIFFLLGCSNSSNCKKFRNGKFQLRDDTDGTVYIISRKDSTQLEYDSTTKKISRSTIKWISDCEYEMYYEKNVLGRADSILKLQKKRTLDVRILESADSYYIFEAKMDGVPVVYSDTMRIYNGKFPVEGK